MRHGVQAATSRLGIDGVGLHGAIGFTADYDATVRQVISATVGTGPFNITILAKPPDEDSKEE